MLVKVLVENDKREDIKGIKASHGLSLYIETREKRILLDLGGSDLFIKNAIAMGISIEDVDTLIISHGHLDHIGGLDSFLKVNTRARVYLHKDVKQKFIAKVLGFIPLNISINPDIYNEYRKRFIFIDRDHEIAPGINLLTGFSREFPEPPSNSTLYISKERKKVRDNFSHEIALTIIEDGKTTLFSSCSHSGIYNIIRCGKERLKQDIGSVIGGFHLYNPATGRSANREYLNSLAEALNKLPTTYYTCHCTGVKSYRFLRRTLEDRLLKISTGDSFTI